MTQILLIGLPAAALSWLGALWLGWLAAGRPHSTSQEADPLILAWVGWYLQSLIVLGCGWLGLLDPVSLTAILAIPAAAVVFDRRFLRSWLPAAVEPYVRVWRGLSWWGVGCGALLFLWLGLMLSLPVFHYDCLTYGWGQPLHWLIDGRISPPGLDVFAYTSVPQRMHAVLALGAVGEAMATVAPLGFVAAAVLLVVRAAARHGIAASSPGPLLAGALILLTPTVWDLLALRKEDLAVLHGAAALVLMATALRDGPACHRRRLIILGLAGAALLAAKPMVTVGFTAAATVAAVRPPGRRWLGSGAFASLAKVAGVGILALLPLAAHTWRGAGHPLAAGAPHLGREPLATNRWHKILDDAYPMQAVPLAQLPAEIVSEAGRFVEPDRWNFGDFLGVGFLLGVPLTLVLRRAPHPERWLIAAGILGWYLTFHRPRFALVLVPAAATALAILLDRWNLRRTVPLVVVAIAAVNSGIWLETQVGSIFRAHILSRESRTDFLPASIAVLETANRQLDPTRHRVLFVGESRVYPCRIPFEYWNPNFRHPFERLESSTTPEDSWEAHVRDRGITHIVYSPQVARAYMELSPRLFTRLETWLARRGRVIALESDRDATTVLLEIRAAEASAPISSRPRPGRPTDGPSR